MATPMLAVTAKSVSVECGCVSQPGSHALCRGQGVAGAVEVLHQHCELVTAEPGDGIAGSGHAQQLVRSGAQKSVAGLMSETVVHVLEAVEIDDHHGYLGLRAAGAISACSSAVVEQRPVGQPESSS